MNTSKHSLAGIVAVLAMATAVNVSAVECFPEVKMQEDLASRGFTLMESVKAENMDLLAFQSFAEQAWVLMARPPEGSVKDAPTKGPMLCPLDSGKGDLESLKTSPYYQKFFSPPTDNPAEG